MSRTKTFFVWETELFLPFPWTTKLPASSSSSSLITISFNRKLTQVDTCGFKSVSFCNSTIFLITHRMQSWRRTSYFHFSFPLLFWSSLAMHSLSIRDVQTRWHFSFIQTKQPTLKRVRTTSSKKPGPKREKKRNQMKVLHRKVQMWRTALLPWCSASGGLVLDWSLEYASAILVEAVIIGKIHLYLTEKLGVPSKTVLEDQGRTPWGIPGFSKSVI